MSSTSAVLAELEGEALKIAKENEELKDMIIKDNSLISVRDRSEDLGYTSPNTTFYITKEDSVALLE